ncbi:hypothetical protein pb186bvf_004209 [Paramecium bursaria]
MKQTFIQCTQDEIEEQIDESAIHLVVMRCGLQVIPPYLSDTLLALDLSYNKLTQAYDLPRNLIYLNLSYNLIQDIRDINKSDRLEYLNLTQNPVAKYKNLSKNWKLRYPRLIYLDNVLLSSNDTLYMLNAKSEYDLEYVFENDN